MKTELEAKFLELIEKRDLIPEEFWGRGIDPKVQRIWILDRADGTAAEYEVSEERLGITRDGNVIWGYVSGCSCWNGWEPDDYREPKSPKEFLLKSHLSYDPKADDRYSESWAGDDKITFSDGWEDVCLATLHDFLLLTQKNPPVDEVLRVKNVEIRRYLMKRVGFQNIKDKLNARVVHVDGTSELLEIDEGPELGKNMYVKVKDSSTEREYLLWVNSYQMKTCRQAIAWTFGLTEDQYCPIKET